MSRYLCFHVEAACTTWEKFQNEMNVTVAIDGQRIVPHSRMRLYKAFPNKLYRSWGHPQNKFCWFVELSEAKWDEIQACGHVRLMSDWQTSSFEFQHELVLNLANCNFHKNFIYTGRGPNKAFCTCFSRELYREMNRPCFQEEMEMKIEYAEFESSIQMKTWMPGYIVAPRGRRIFSPARFWGEFTSILCPCCFRLRNFYVPTNLSPSLRSRYNSSKLGAAFKTENPRPFSRAAGPKDRKFSGWPP